MVFNALFLFSFFFFFHLASLSIGNNSSHSLSLSGLDFNPHSSQNRARGEHAITPQDLLHQATLIGSGMVTWSKPGQTSTCQNSQGTIFHILWGYDVLGPWKSAASGGHLDITDRDCLPQDQVYTEEKRIEMEKKFSGNLQSPLYSSSWS